MFRLKEKDVIASNTQSQVFKPNIFFWKIFGWWPEVTSTIYYRCYYISFLSLTSVVYLFLFTLSLLYSPIELEIIIAQAMFYFTEISGLSKIFMIVIRREDIQKAFKMLDSEEFQGDDVIPREIINKNKVYYLKYYRACATFYYIGSFFLLFLPIIEYVAGHADLELPLCQYYFLSEHVRDKYFNVIFIYQFFGLFVLISGNVNIDTFICGLLLMAIAQFRMLNWKMSNLKMNPLDLENESDDEETIMMRKLNKCLKHYDLILEYCDHIQDVLSAAIFAQYGTAAATMCLSMCTVLMPMTSEDWLFMGCYIGAMTLEIFLPGLLGAELMNESQKLVAAAYSADWIPRSESFKRSLRLLVERANRPIVITGLKMFTLSLETFTSIIKLAYSFFTLLKNVQETEIA
uniref:Odorant receptor n=1 Tax=Ostrinia furnacalis TaxID=93504 RepID=A0A0E3VLQ0_OSTFU|nr:putative olfactory receptor 10 [Ostrinia furnacalis]